MYKSAFADSEALQFAFDPLRSLHAHEDSKLQWPEFPYKQVVIDRVRVRAGRGCNGETLSVEGAAGALLMASGQETGALFHVEQHCPRDGDSDGLGWGVLEQRFLDERAAFRAAKREFIRGEKAKVKALLDAQAAREQDEKEQAELAAWKARQIIRRYEDGSKYDGDGVAVHNVLVPHGFGTLWVPEGHHMQTAVLGADVKRVPRYVGEWADGFMHGRGTYYWATGESWAGNFMRNEMQGKGVYSSSQGDEQEDVEAASSDFDGEEDSKAAPTSGSAQPLVLRANQRIRYYDASQHVCWGDELVRGCKLRLFENRQFGDPLASVVKRYNVDLEEETDAVVVRYDPQTDRHLVRKGETEQTRWLSLSNSNFRVLVSRPIARLLDE